VVQDDRPARVKGLVLFLSPPGQDTDLIQQIFDGKTASGINDKHFRERFVGAWRMPLEAIFYHLERLKEVVIIPSADLTKADGSQVPGTFLKVEMFIRLVSTLIQLSNPKGDLRLRGFAQCIADSNLDEKPCADFSRGVDFEKVAPLVEAVEFSYDILRSLGIPSYDVLVDITGGQKVPTVAGAAVALADGRHFQYVSTHDYQVRTYDVTYLP
jgi:hypothetical protein